MGVTSSLGFVTRFFVARFSMIVTGPLTGCHLTTFQVPAGLPNANHVFFMHTNANALPGLATSTPMRNHAMTAVFCMPAGTPHSTADAPRIPQSSLCVGSGYSRRTCRLVTFTMRPLVAGVLLRLGGHF
jgi:hypothetical protein